MSSETLAEYNRAAIYPRVVERLGSHVAQADGLIDALRTIAELHDPGQIEPVVVNDPKDDMFIACAVAARAHYIVSSDKHLLELEQYRGIQILKPGDMLKLLLSSL